MKKELNPNFVMLLLAIVVVVLIIAIADRPRAPKVKVDEVDTEVLYEYIDPVTSNKVLYNPHTVKITREK